MTSPQPLTSSNVDEVIARINGQFYGQEIIHVSVGLDRHTSQPIAGRTFRRVVPFTPLTRQEGNGNNHIYMRNSIVGRWDDGSQQVSGFFYETDGAYHTFIFPHAGEIRRVTLRQE